MTPLEPLPAPPTCTHKPRCADFPAHQAAQQADWKRADSALKATRRRGRVWRKPAQYKPGMNVRRQS